MQQNTTKLTIREGGFYRTRDGRKVGPMSDVSARTAYFHDRHDGESCCYVDGKIKFDRSECGGDLVDEWRDEGTLRDLDVKPGDVVECGTSKTSATAPGSHYTIAVCPLDGDPRSYLDDEGDWCEDTPGYTFRLVSRAPAATSDADTIQRVMEASAPAVDDPVSHPAHYTSHPSGVECLTITRWMGFNLGNAMKYIWRADMKGAAIEDLRKAAFYIADEIAKREAGVIDPASYRVEARG
jgi:hypothetical protein